MNLPDLLGKVRIDNSQAKVALTELKVGSAGAATSAAGLGAAFGVGMKAVDMFGISVLKVASSFVEMISGFADTGSKLVDLNKQLGIGVVELQKIQYAAKQSGVEFSSVTTALMQMEKSASKAPERFAQLGISFEQVKNSKPDQLLGLVADGMKNVGDESDRTRIAMEIFGRGGSQILKLLMDDYRGLTAEAESTGLMTEEMAKKADRLGDASSKLDDAIKKLKDNLGAAFASPEIISMMEKAAGFIGLMAQNAEKLAFVMKAGMKAGMSAGGSVGSWAGQKTVDWFRMIANGGQMPEDFSGVTGGGSSANVKDQDSVWGNASKVLAAAAADEKRAAADAFRAAKAADEALLDMVRARFNDQQALYGDMVRKNEAALPFIERAALASLPGSLAVPTGADGKPKQYSFDNSTNFSGVTKGSFDAGKALQTFAHIAELSSSKLGKSISSIAGGLAGVLAGKDSMSGLGGGVMGLLGKISGIGSIVSAGLGIFSGIKSLFGGGDKEKKERAAAAAQAASEAAAAEKEKRSAGLSTFAGGLNAFAAGGITDQASSDRAGRYAQAAFGSKVAETGDIFGALGSIGPTLDAMAKAAKELGLELPKGVASLLQLDGLDENLKSQVTGLNSMSKGISDAGLMSKEMFADLGADSVAMKAKLEEAGLSGAQSMAIMQPTLQQLYEAQKLHGYAVDESTQALMDEAKAQGMVGDQFMSANEQMVDLMKILIEAVGGTLPDAYKRAGDAAEEYGRRASESAPSYHVTPVLDGGTDGDGLPGYAVGSGGLVDFGRGTSVMLHGREAVVTESEFNRGGGGGGGGGRGSAPIVLTAYLTLPDGRILTTLVTDTVRSEGRESQDLRSALNGDR